MKRFISDLKCNWRERPFVWTEGPGEQGAQVRLPAEGRVLVMAPHPDDPESAAVTSRLLRRAGCDVRYAVVTLSPAGVDDEYARRFATGETSDLREAKAEIRRNEQIRAAEMFGLGAERLAFLDIREEGENTPLDSTANRARIGDQLESVAPDIVIMPVGRDTNRTHAWIHEVFRECAGELARQFGRPLVGLYNEDPKTTEMCPDLFVCFGEESARWKRTLLRAHDSQQQRNIRLRGVGFDERILRVNRQGRRRLPDASPLAVSSLLYAEVFEMELFDSR